LDAFTLSDGDPAAWSALKGFGDLEVFDRSNPDEVLARSREATILITNKARVGTDVIEQSPKLRMIAVSATGYDCVNIAAASQRGIAVANVPEYGTDSVAQFTFALLLELCHHVGLHAEAVRSGDWSRSPDFCFWKTPQVELAGRTIGIVGFGRIGRRVGELAHAFGMRVVACSRTRTDPPSHQPFAWSTLDDVTTQSDVISLHCPLTPDTRGLVNRERLRRMKPTAFLINTSRGGLVVDTDLADALNSGGIAGAALDVISSEPIATDNPLHTARNCLITPHIAWATTAARRRLLDGTIASVEAFLAGRSINLVVDPLAGR
jgi:glycerate dehydrogenase